MGTELAYGHWGTMIFNTIIWTGAGYLLIRPERALEHLAFAGFALFQAVTYAEAYGYPFTLSLLAGQMARYGAADQLGWRAGDLWRVLFEGTARGEGYDWFHILAGILMFGGLIVLYLSRRSLEAARDSGVPATTGPYGWVRHPQYMALFAIMLGNLVQSPSLFTLVLFPVLVYGYNRMARSEEQAVTERFGQAYALYCQRTPRFLR
jgi:hypothetical protein